MSVGRPSPIARGLLLAFLIVLLIVVLTPSENHSLEFLANIVLFLPFGFLLPFAFRFPWEPRYLVIILPAFFGLGVSLLIETTQLWIPGRFSDPRDLVANATGAFLGA